LCKINESIGELYYKSHNYNILPQGTSDPSGIKITWRIHKKLSLIFHYHYMYVYYSLLPESYPGVSPFLKIQGGTR